MASIDSLARRVSELEEPSNIDDLPMASLCLIIAADEIEETDDERVILLDGKPHRTFSVSELSG